MDLSQNLVSYNRHILTIEFDHHILLNDPYQMGRISCANILSPIHSQGIIRYDNLGLMIGVPIGRPISEIDKRAIPIIVKGFEKSAEQAHVSISSVAIQQCPLARNGLSLTGFGSSAFYSSAMILPSNAEVGDFLILTKPLGTQVVLNAHHLVDPLRFGVSQIDINIAYLCAMDSMARLNTTAARLLHIFNAHGATEVNELGLLRNAQNLAKCQRNAVSFIICILPIFAKMAQVSNAFGNRFQLLQGHSAETSGGLLICLARNHAVAYCHEIRKREGYQAWIIGKVEEGNRTASIVDYPRVIELV